MTFRKKPGYCVYYFAHRGIGRCIEEVDDMEETKKRLESKQPHNDIFHIVCDVDKKKAIEKYDKLIKKQHPREIIKKLLIKNKKEREKRKTQKLNKSKRKTHKLKNKKTKK